MDYQRYSNRKNITTRSHPVKNDNPVISLKYVESSSLLSEKYSIREKTVKKVITIVERIMEVNQIFGLVDFPKSNGEFVEMNRYLTKIERYNMRRANHAFYKSVHRYLHVLSIIGEQEWVKLFKWKFCAFFSYHKGQDIPICKFSRGDNKDCRQVFKPWFLIGGIVHDFNYYMEANMPEQFFEFLTSILHLKKGCPRMDEEMVQIQIEETMEKLTTDPVLPSFDLGLDLALEENQQLILDRNFPVFQNVGCPELIHACQKDEAIAQCRRTTRELFGKSRLCYKSMQEPFFPSCSAHFINSRAEGGAAGMLFCDEDNKKFFNYDEDLLSIGIENVHCRDPKSWHYGRYGRMEDESLKNQGGSLDLFAEVPSLVIDDTDLKSRWTVFYWAQWEKAKAEIPLVAPVGLVEPLKVRVITKGPAYLYTVLKPVQKFLWRTLKNNRIFELISRYVTEDDIDYVDHENGRLIEKYNSRLIYGIQHKWMLLSGDYSGATDNLFSYISNNIVNEIVDCWRGNATLEDITCLPKDFFEDLRSFMLTALTGHIIDFGGKALEQKNGQLMGSIISFPILCIANAALCRRAQEIDRWYYDDVFGHSPEKLIFQQCDELSLRSYNRGPNSRYSKVNPLPLLINGDDCLMRGTPFLKKIWEELCKAYGFTPSIGKTYWSDEFCTINSSTFRRVDREDPDTMGEYGPRGDRHFWREVKYVNSGLLHGLKRSCAGNSDPQQAHGNLGVIARELKRSSPNEVWYRVKSLFIQHNRNKLNHFSEMSLPWFIPEWLGGVGLPRDEETISEEDRSYCTIIRSKFADLIAAEKTDIDWKVNELVLKQLAMWQGRGLETTNFQRMIVDGEEQVLEENYLKAYKLMCVSLLFSRPFEELKNSEKRVKFKERRRGGEFDHRLMTSVNPNGLRFLKKNAVIWKKARDIVRKEGVWMDLMYDDEFEHEKRKFFFPMLEKELRVAVPDIEGALSAGWR